MPAMSCPLEDTASLRYHMATDSVVVDASLTASDYVSAAAAVDADAFVCVICFPLMSNKFPLSGVLWRPRPSSLAMGIHRGQSRLPQKCYGQLLLLHGHGHGLSGCLADTSAEMDTDTLCCSCCCCCCCCCPACFCFCWPDGLIPGSLSVSATQYSHIQQPSVRCHGG